MQPSKKQFRKITECRDSQELVDMCWKDWVELASCIAIKCHPSWPDLLLFIFFVCVWLIGAVPVCISLVALICLIN